MDTDLTSETIAKLKVPELKKELKLRDLPSSGNKGELVARLELALAEAGDDVVDEEALLGGEEDVALEEEPPTVPDTPSDSTPAVKEPVDSKPSVPETEEERIAKRQERFGVTNDSDAKSKRAARFGIVNDEDKKKARAAKFGITADNQTTSVTSGVQDDSKKQQRAARFGITDDTNKPANNKAKDDSAGMTEEERQKLLKRRERFGEAVSEKVITAEIDEKKERRAARFGAVVSAPGAIDDEERKKKRAAKFGA